MANANINTHMKKYNITAVCPNETVAESFVEYWKHKGYECIKVQQSIYSNDGLQMGSWAVYRTTKKQTTNE